jgi:hypothetical protein
MLAALARGSARVPGLRTLGARIPRHRRLLNERIPTFIANGTSIGRRRAGRHQQRRRNGENVLPHFTDPLLHAYELFTERSGQSHKQRA